MSEGKKLVFLAGEGYGYAKEDGKFEVKYGEEVKEFAKLTDAINFYENLKEESALWDVTRGAELLAAKAFEE